MAALSETTIACAASVPVEAERSIGPQEGCVASVPVEAERSIGPQEGVFTFGTRVKWGESKRLFAVLANKDLQEALAELT